MNKDKPNHTTLPLHITEDDMFLTKDKIREIIEHQDDSDTEENNYIITEDEYKQYMNATIIRSITETWSTHSTKQK